MTNKQLLALTPSCVDCRYHSTHRLADVFPIDHLCGHPDLMSYRDDQGLGVTHKTAHGATVQCNAMREDQPWRSRCGIEGRCYQPVK